MSASPGDAVEVFGWGPTVAIALSAVSAILAIGGSKQLLKGLEQKVSEVAASAKATAGELTAYKEAAREKFAIAEDLQKIERNLGSKIETSHQETRRQVEELRTEIGRKNITHTINNAITAGMAQAVKELRAREERA